MKTDIELIINALKDHCIYLHSCDDRENADRCSALARAYESVVRIGGYDRFLGTLGTC